VGSDNFIDPRDDQNYRTVRIGNLTWMAENLNYKIGDSCCYANNEANGGKYGRLYTWDDAMAACPAGWRISTDADWDDLVSAAGGSGVAGERLKSREWGGTDDFGFAALPGGNGYEWCNYFRYAGFSGYWWSDTEEEVADEVWYRSMD
jgi:uncharacterized protein (TIGR02145 family)